MIWLPMVYSHCHVSTTQCLFVVRNVWNQKRLPNFIHDSSLKIVKFLLSSIERSYCCGCYPFVIKLLYLQKQCIVFFGSIFFFDMNIINHKLINKGLLFLTATNYWSTLVKWWNYSYFFLCYFAVQILTYNLVNVVFVSMQLEYTRYDNFQHVTLPQKKLIDSFMQWHYFM